MIITEIIESICEINRKKEYNKQNDRDKQNKISGQNHEDQEYINLKRVKNDTDKINDILNPHLNANEVIILLNKNGSDSVVIETFKIACLNGYESIIKCILKEKTCITDNVILDIFKNDCKYSGMLFVNSTRCERFANNTTFVFKSLKVAYYYNAILKNFILFWLTKHHDNILDVFLNSYIDSNLDLIKILIYNKCIDDTIIDLYFTYSIEHNKTAISDFLIYNKCIKNAMLFNYFKTTEIKNKCLILMALTKHAFGENDTYISYFVRKRKNDFKKTIYYILQNIDISIIKCVLKIACCESHKEIVTILLLQYYRLHGIKIDLRD